MSDVADFFLCLRLDHVGEKCLREFLVGTGGGDHQMVDPSGGVFFRDSFADGEIQFLKIVGHQRPAHGEDHFVVLEEVGEFAAGGPHFADVGLEFDELFLYGVELRRR